MDVNLQIVGIFYNVTLSLPDTGQTVQSLLNAAVKTPNPAGSTNGATVFNYATHLDTPTSPATMSSISATYDQGFKSRILTNTYPAGTYTLKESYDPNSASPAYTVWQYYMFDKNGVYVPPSAPSEAFSKQSLDNVARVTWRLVSILGGPTTTVSSSQPLVARDPRVRGSGLVKK